MNVKIPTIVAILTFISRVNTTYESFKQERINILNNFTKYTKYYTNDTGVIWTLLRMGERK